MIKCDKDPKWASPLFVQLYGSIYYWRTDGKEIVDATKLVKEMMQY